MSRVRGRIVISVAQTLIAELCVCLLSLRTINMDDLPHGIEGAAHTPAIKEKTHTNVRRHITPAFTVDIDPCPCQSWHPSVVR